MRLPLPGETGSLALLVDYPDFVSDPFTIARASNPFALALAGNALYVADASFNLVSQVNVETGAAQTLARFAPLANPLPFGPPVIDVVPDGLRVYNEQLLVTFLTGFPFPSGKSEVRSLALRDASQSTFIGGLTTAIDVLPARTRLGAEQFYVLEISTDLSQGKPGRLLRFDAPTAAPQVIASGLIGPVGLARDARSGDLFITENFTGRIIQILGAEFDVCLQDDETGAVLRFNSLTGEYLFVHCQAGVTLTGRGRVNRAGCVLQLSNTQVIAEVEQCPFSSIRRGNGLIRRTRLGQTFFLSDSNTADNTCTGR